MPASEQTWRNQPLMHVIFGISSLSMLLATIWMMAADHTREWKGYQRKFRDIEAERLQWQVTQQETEAFVNQAKALQSQLAQSRSEMPNLELLQAFADEMAVHVLMSRQDGTAEQPLDGMLNEAEFPEGLSFGTFDRNGDDVVEPEDLLGVGAPGQREVNEDALASLRQWSPAAKAIAKVSGLVEEGQALQERLSDDESDAALSEIKAYRDKVIAACKTLVGDAQFAEELKDRDLRNARAEFGEASSRYQLAIHKGVSDEELQRLNAEVERIQKQVDKQTFLVQAAKDYRTSLEAILGMIRAEETEIQGQIAAHEREVERLHKAWLDRRGNLGKTILEMPVLDAFNSPLKIEQIWLKDLTINYNFSNVDRYDRCITCHLGMQKTEPGSATKPAYLPEHRLTVHLPTPEKQPEAPGNPEEILAQVYGMQLAAGLGPEEVVVNVVWPRAAAENSGYASHAVDARVISQDGSAEAAASVAPGLKMGDVIVSINGANIDTVDTAMRYLWRDVAWGEPLELVIRRGYQHPYTTHPRLDLFVGSLSPHKMMEFGCTYCHEGQGSATAFKWASHTPNTPLQQEAWEKEYGWFNNHHWIYYMRPQRFLESSCIRCHHGVTELRPSEKYPEPPAPKLMAGYDNIRTYGCYGCHEISGYNGPQQVGPDLRTEPNFHEAAAQVLADPYLQTEEGQQSPAYELAHAVIQKPYNEGTRKELAKIIESDAEQVAGSEDKAEAKFNAVTHDMAGILGADIDHPGPFTKRGPSLRYLNYKAGEQFLYDWIKEPKHFRPTTRMPQFFGLHKHLPHPERFQAIEDWPSLVEALSAQATADASSAKHRVWEALPEATRAAIQAGGAPDDPRFQQQVIDGLMQILPQRDFYQPEAFSGLELSADIQAFLNRSRGDLSDAEVQWLNHSLLVAAFPAHLPPAEAELDEAYRYEPVEVLAVTHYLLKQSQSQPFEYLEPPEGTEPPSAERGRYLFQTRGCMACHTHNDVPDAGQTQGPDLSHLGSKLTGEKGKQWLYTWLKQPNSYHARTRMPDLYLDPTETDGPEGKKIKIDPAADIVEFLLKYQDKELYKLPDINAAGPQKALDELALLYLGKSNLTLREARKFLEEGIPQDYVGRIQGDELMLMGEIDTQKKLEYVGVKTIGRLGCAGCHDIPGFEKAKPIGTGLNNWGRKETSQLAFEQITGYLGIEHGGHGGNPYEHSKVELQEGETDQDAGFYLNSILHHQREGFAWQKLREPRSYDYLKTAHKGYDERLRMPQFPFDPAQRESIITFVIGLVAEPPESAKYIYSPGPRRKAILEGERVLEKYNCQGCHELEMEEWIFEYDPKKYNQEPPPANPKVDYAFLRPQFSEEEWAEATTPNRRGQLRVALRARQIPWQDPEEPDLVDDEENPMHFYRIWEPAIVGGKVWAVPSDIAMTDKNQVGYAGKQMRPNRPAVGGKLGHTIFDLVLAEERKYGQVADPNAAWGWLPPPLMGEGRKVQTDWLYQFLLNPYPIRPSVVLRMPHFHMAPEEARALANYFAAAEGEEFPYEFIPQTEADYIARKNSQFGPSLKQDTYLGAAFKIVAAAKPCLQCHRLGDYEPKARLSAQAPNLNQVHSRMRPTWLKEWLAYPKRLLPTTAMPENFDKQNPAAYADRFPGSSPDRASVEQIIAVRDLLLNYPHYVSHSQVSVKEQVEAQPPPAGNEATGGGDAATGGNSGN